MFLCIVALSWRVALACVETKGIGSNGFYQVEDLNLPTPGPTGADGVLRQYVTVGRETQDQLETPIATRSTMYDFICFFNIAGTYEPNALDFWGREDISNDRRFCQYDDIDSSISDTERKTHRLVSLIYGVLYVLGARDSQDAVQEWKNTMNDTFGLDPDICDSQDCSSSTATPWALAKVVTDEIFRFELADGWNRNGDYNREYNNIPFSDFREPNTRYVPVNNPWSLDEIERWQPLLDDDTLGFLFYQEHVTPHIGFTGKSMFFTNDEFCQKKSPRPDYNYTNEFQLLFERMTSLTDLQKIEIEKFDQKYQLNVLTFFYEFFRGNNIDSWNYIVSSVIELVSLYESILLSWKEKVVHDRVRPTSIIQDLLGDTLVTTYAGTTLDGASFGTQTFLGSEFETYIPTMPHSEYPSSSACMCAAYAAAKVEEYGSDFIFPSIFFFPSPPFSSRREPLSTPKTTIIPTYSQWSDISNRCSQTRLEGGMHFSAAVPAGEQLCKSIGPRVAQSVLALVNGEQPQYVVAYETSLDSIVERMQCYRPRDPNNLTDPPTKQPTEEPAYQI